MTYPPKSAYPRVTWGLILRRGEVADPLEIRAGVVLAVTLTLIIVITFTCVTIGPAIGWSYPALEAERADAAVENYHQLCVEQVEGKMHR